jgi:predicted DNA-binding transcriptional regulator AlpA
MSEQTIEPDQLVPDPQVWRELGVSSMTGWRWSRDVELDFPPAIQIRGRNFRSRRLLELWKARMLRRAIAARAVGGKALAREA